MATTIYSDWCNAWTPAGATYARKFRIWVTYTLSQATGVYTQAKFTNVSFGVELNLSNGGTFNSGVVLKINNTQIFKTTTTTKTVYSSSNPTLKFTLGSGGSLNVNRTDDLPSVTISVSSVTYVSEGSRSVSLNKNIPINKLYTLTYNANGGSAGSIANGAKQYKSSEANITLKTTGAFKRTNYTLKGWNTAGGGTGTSYNLGATYSTNASCNLYAQWQLNYVKPTISITSIKRYDSNENEDTEGNKAKIICKYTRGYYAGASSHDSSIVTHINIKIGSTIAADFNVTNGTEISQQTYTSGLLSGTYDKGTTYTVTATITETPSSAYGTQTGTATTTLSAAIYPIVINKTANMTFGIPVIFGNIISGNINVSGTITSGKINCISTGNGITHKRTSAAISASNPGISLMVGSGQVNRGVYDDTTSKWLIYGNNSNQALIPDDWYFKYNGQQLFTSAGIYLSANQSATLSHTALDFNGIVLAWSRYDVTNSTSLDYGWQYTYIPRWHIANHPSAGVRASLTPYSDDPSLDCVKYFYVKATEISGHAYNVAHGTGYDNRLMVLRAVIGV